MTWQRGKGQSLCLLAGSTVLSQSGRFVGDFAEAFVALSPFTLFSKTFSILKMAVILSANGRNNRFPSVVNKNLTREVWQNLIKKKTMKYAQMI